LISSNNTADKIGSWLGKWFLKFWHCIPERGLVTSGTIIMSLYVPKHFADYQMLVVIFLLHHL
jgi:hypothetical protein